MEGQSFNYYLPDHFQDLSFEILGNVRALWNHRSAHRLEMPVQLLTPF